MESNTWNLTLPRLAIATTAAAALLLLGLLLGVPTIAWESASPQAPDACVPGPHSGAITAAEEWCPAHNPHLVTGDVTVQNDAVLTIQPGVIVRFATGTGLYIGNLSSPGKLVADGLVGQSITFTANFSPGIPPRGFWDGIEFAANSPTNTVSYCLIEYANTGIFINDADGHIIEHCTLRHNGDASVPGSGGAINVDGDIVTLANNEIYDNDWGVRLRKSNSNMITGNLIHDNGDFGLGFVVQGGSGGDNNVLSGNRIYANGGDGLQLDAGFNNIVTGNLIYGNGGHGVWARSQAVLQFTENVVRGNGQDGLAYDTPNFAPTALHSNVLCSNGSYDLENLWSTSLLAEGNWFGTNTPLLGVEVSGTVDIDPWITMAVSLAPDTLPADGTSTASLALTMTNGTYAVPDGHTVDVSASEGSVAPASLVLSGGQAMATYTAGTVPGAVTFSASDQCATLDFVGELTLQEVDLAVFKAGPGGTVAPGDVVAYTVTISELNGVDARDLLLTDLLPTGTSWVSDTAAACGLSRQTTAPDVTWTSDLWSGGTSCTFSLQVLVGGDACQSQRLENTVTVSSAASDSNLANNTWTTGDDSPGIVCLDLAVSKTDGGLIVGPNKEYFIEYTFTVSNVGVVTTTGVVVTDTLPAEATYTGSDWTCAVGVCSHAVGSLPLSATAELTLPVQLDKAALSCPVVLTNVVRVADSSGLDMNPANNVFTRTTTFDCLPDLVVVVNDNVGAATASTEKIDSSWVLELLGALPEAETLADCVYPGQWITYTIAYVNTGLATATQVVLTETVPEHTSYMGYGWTCIGTTCTRAVGTLVPGAGGVAHFAVRVDTAPPDLTVEDEVRIGGAEEDLYPPDNVSSDDTPICEGLVLNIRKEADAPCAFPGDEIRYTIVFTNPSGETATSMVLTETLPAHTSYLTTAGWLSLGGGQFAYSVGDLGPFASGTAEFVVVIDDPLPDTVTEIVNVVCMGYDGPTPPGNCYTLVTPLPLEPDLRVVKHDYVGPSPPLAAQRELDRMYRLLFNEPFRLPTTVQQWEPVHPGDIYSYTITYLNMGRRPATGVVLTETLPEHTTYVGYGWTHVGGRTYIYSVGDLAPGTGGQRNFYVQAGAVPCDGDDYLYNWVHIDGVEDECNLANNWSGEETPVECETFVASAYLPLILKGYSPTAEPTPTPSPEPTEPPTPPPPPPPEEAYVSDVAVNAETNRVYVASPQLDAVFAVDPSGTGSVIAAIPVGDHPLGLAVVTTTNKIYAANLNSWTVTAIRGSDHTPIADIYVGAQACKVAADSGDARVYATNHLESDNGAAAIDSHTDTFQYYYSRLHATQGRYGIDVDPAAEKLFIAARDAGLIAIQDAFLPDQEPQVFKLDPPRVPYVVAFNPATNHLFVTAADDNLVVVLDPYSIQWNKGKWLLWRGRWVFELDKANAGWIKEIGVGAGAEEGIAVNPLTGYVYVTNADSDTVSILRDNANPANINWVMDLAVGEHPLGVDVDVNTNTIYVGNAWSRDLTVIDGATHTVVKTIPLD